MDHGGQPAGGSTSEMAVLSAEPGASGSESARMASARDFVTMAYRFVLQRAPGEEELASWARQIMNGMPDRDLMQRFVDSAEYRKRFEGIAPAHPAGHYYSPVVDPRELVGARAPHRAIEPKDIPGIDLNIEEMRRWWHEVAVLVAATPFPPKEHPNWRYYPGNGSYPIGDAVTLRAMMAQYRPKRIVEVGSGYSSAAMLDTIDEFGLSTAITCIEPYADRLRGRLRAGDERHLRILEQPVQAVPLAEFRALDADDILFIDSTHVLKTGSDVHFELFSILPVLKPGVIIHFHDIPYPFEYPDIWIFERQYSWNEVYAVRAFLMNNNSYRVMFMNNLFFLKAQDLIRATFPPFNDSPGSSLWVRKLS
ncbi:MAG: class I SAM-dependent methyltransferase [Bauldia sp.]|nr:class I SAM-dependent methyltransferase [Bauldia sp.]MCW5717087.1 class I SAM-dependent methyltransferase [Bauldia sp.]